MRRPHRPPARLRLAPLHRLTERLVAAFLFGLALFNPPLLAVFGVGASIGGFPLLYLYLFTAWGGLILILAVVIERSRGGDGEAPE